MVVVSATSFSETAGATPTPAHITEPLRFAKFTVYATNKSPDIKNLINAKVYIGTDNSTAYLFLSKNETNYIRTETVKKYRAAIKAGFAARSTADLSSESWFLQVDQILSFMERARPSRHSLISVKDFKYLPVSILNWNEGEEEKQLSAAALKGMTISDYATPHSNHPVHSIKFKGNIMTFSDAGCDYAVQELARGDYDGDGYEDALVLISTNYQGGSGRFNLAYLVSKTDPKQRQLKLTKMDAVLQSTTDRAIITKRLLQ